MAPNIVIPEKQTVALVRKQGGPVEFVDDYPVPKPGKQEVLAKVLYCGVCQSGINAPSLTNLSLRYPSLPFPASLTNAIPRIAY